MNDATPSTYPRAWAEVYFENQNMKQSTIQKDETNKTT